MIGGRNTLCFSDLWSTRFDRTICGALLYPRVYLQGVRRVLFWRGSGAKGLAGTAAPRTELFLLQTRLLGQWGRACSRVRIREEQGNLWMIIIHQSNESEICLILNLSSRKPKPRILKHKLFIFSPILMFHFTFITTIILLTRILQNGFLEWLFFVFPG